LPFDPACSRSAQELLFLHDQQVKPAVQAGVLQLSQAAGLGKTYWISSDGE
jgi:hypothetical protein